MRAVAGLLLVAAAACSSGSLEPVAFDAANEPCRLCRMVGSNGRFAAQLVARRQNPLFFDDIGCLRDFLRTRDGVSGEAAAYVVDHRTGDWVPAGQAVYTRNDELDTPMGSHLLAHGSTASREADPDARGGVALSAAAVFADLRLPGGL